MLALLVSIWLHKALNKANHPRFLNHPWYQNIQTQFLLHIMHPKLLTTDPDQKLPGLGKTQRLETDERGLDIHHTRHSTSIFTLFKFRLYIKLVIANSVQQ